MIDCFFSLIIYKISFLLPTLKLKLADIKKVQFNYLLIISIILRQGFPSSNYFTRAEIIFECIDDFLFISYFCPTFGLR